MQKTIWVILRLCMGFIFLWAFFDKVFGLGYATAKGKSWLDGVSPTYGYLKMATYGPFSDLFKSLASSNFVTWIFMLGLLGVGLAMILGVAMKLAAWAGSLMLLFMWLAAFPPKNNPFLDDHLVYIVILIGAALADAGKTFGLDTWWSKTSLVKKYKFLA